MSKISDSDEAGAVMARFLAAEGGMFTMFEQLGLGWSKEDLLEWLHENAAYPELESSGQLGNAAGMAITLTALAVERLQ